LGARDKIHTRQHGGSTLISHVMAARRLGKKRLMRPFRKPLRMRRAALGPSMNNGMGKSFFAVIRLSTKPGQMAVTTLPSGRSAPMRASA